MVCAAPARDNPIGNSELKLLYTRLDRIVDLLVGVKEDLLHQVAEIPEANRSDVLRLLADGDQVGFIAALIAISSE